MPHDANPPFNIGLCLAGAVTAGAYTAGVMDYLIETLQRWEQHKDKAKVPTHWIVIPVIGGASARGMTGILTAAAMNRTFFPVTAPHCDGTATGNPFYNIWVDMTAADMLPQLLCTKDIKKGKVTSFRNSGFIDTLAKRVVDSAGKHCDTPPYFAEYLKVFVTLTNLEGFGFSLPFNGKSVPQPYDMRLHNDYACFVLNKDRAGYADDGWIPLRFAGKVNTDKVNTVTAREAAMATNAFPGVLLARKLTREARYVNDNTWIRYKLGSSNRNVAFQNIAGLTGAARAARIDAVTQEPLARWQAWVEINRTHP